MAVQTLNNRVLLVNPTQMQRIWLVDDADEWPEGDVKCEPALDDYAGIPIELYRLMATWTDSREDFDRLGSGAEREAALNLIESGGFSGCPEDLAGLLRRTTVHFLDGPSVSYEVARESLIDLVDIEEDTEVQIVEISHYEGGPESYVPLSMLRMIEVPTIELEQARSELATRLREECPEDCVSRNITSIGIMCSTLHASSPGIIT